MSLYLVIISCTGGGGAGTTPTTGGETGTITLSGQVAVTSSDLASASLKPNQIALAKKSTVRFATRADSALPSATVTLYKIFANGTEEAVSGVTATTDASGSYTLENVPAAVTGTGASTDFYYEVRATSGSLEVRAPTAPIADTTVNLSPETKIAAVMLTDVAKVPNVSAASVIPTESSIERMRDMVFANISGMKSFTPPSTATTNESNMVIAATAVASSNGNSEKMLRAYEAQKEELYLQQNRTSASTTSIAGYLDRVTKAACNFNSNTKLPQVASSALAQAFKSEQSFTLDKIVTAFNNNNTSPDTTVTNAISAISSVLDNLNTAFTNKTDISGTALLGLYVNRDDLATISSSTTMQPDQALAMVQAMLPSNQQCQGGVDYVGFVGELVGDTSLASTPSFADIELYHQRLQCPQGSLRARIQLYLPQGITANSMSVTADKTLTNPLGNTVTTVQLVESAPGSNIWEENRTSSDEQTCLSFGETYTFTITAALTGAGNISTTMSRTIVDLPEAQISLITPDYAVNQFQTGQPDQPTHITAQRPMFKWLPAPGTPPSSLSAPAGSQIKYLYDITHFNRTTGGPENRDFANCPGEQNNTRFYDKDYILSPIDCDVDRCNTALPDAQHVCRLHVQTVLVDEYDRTLGWSAGADMYFCIQGQSNCQ